MKASLLNLLWTWWPSVKTSQATSRMTVQKDWEDSEIPRYPPFMQGLPVIAPKRILQTQTELIKRIRQTAVVNDQYFNRYYLSVIERFSDYAHLLPASQSHHHRGAGGLFRHSLEVSLYALQTAEKVLLDIAKSPARRREMEPRWQLAVFLAALCHDAGKPATDMTIANRDRSSIWKPIKESLFTWANRCGVDAYFLDWREGRARQHTAMANLVADRIIGTDALVWIEEGGIELIVWLMESLNANPSPVNPLHGLIILADQTSVERDLKTIGATMAGYDLGVPVERLLIDIMRRLVREGIWLVNEPGARVWKIAGNTYLVWPAGGEDIARIIREDRTPGLARTAEGILDMLVERKLIHIREDSESPYWQIAPGSLKQKIPDIQLQAIRLNDDIQVSPMPLQQVEGEVYGIYNTSQRTEDDDQQSLQDASPTAVMESQAAAEPPSTLPDGIMPAHAPILPKPDTIELDGEAGRILTALLQSLKSGKRQWGRDALLDDKKQLLIRWPDALSDCGLPAKSILDELSTRQWLWIDPVTPWKKVVDISLRGEVIKAIRLEQGISQVCMNMLGHSGDVSQVGRNAEWRGPIGKSPGTSPDNRQAPTQKQSEHKTDFPSPDELLAIVRNMESIQPDKDGWYSLDRKVLAKAVRSAGYRCTVIFLTSIAKQLPERFMMEGTVFRCKG